MAVLKYKDLNTGEIKTVGSPQVNAYPKETIDLKLLVQDNKIQLQEDKLNSQSDNLVNHTNNKNNPHGVTASQIGAAPAYTYGTTDLTPGSSALETGKLYFVYE